MEKMLLEKHDDLIQKDIAALNNQAHVLNNVIDNYTALGLSIMIDSLSTLYKLISDPKEFCNKSLMESLPANAEIGGLKLNRNKLFELSMPEAMPSFIDATEKMIKTSRFKAHAGCMIGDIDLDNFDFKGGHVLVKESTIESVERNHSFYIETDEQIQFYKAYLNLIEAADAFRPLVTKYSGPLNITAGEVIVTSVDSGLLKYPTKDLIKALKRINQKNN